MLPFGLENRNDNVSVDRLRPFYEEDTGRRSQTTNNADIGSAIAEEENKPVNDPEQLPTLGSTQQTCLCWANVGPTFVVTLEQRRMPTLDQRCFAHWAYGGPTVGANHLPTFSQC